MLRIGAVGTGFGAAVQVPAFQAVEGIEVVALSARHQARADAAAARLGVPLAFEGFEAMIASPDVDAVYVGSPPSLHREIAVLAAERRKHVLCEKPVGVCAADARTMTDSVSSADLVGMVNFEFRYRPARRLLGTLLTDGIIGAPRSIHVVNSGGFLDNPRRGWNWWSVSRKGGGLVEAAGSHLLDAVVQWLGPVCAVQASLHTAIDRRLDAETGEFRAVETDDSFTLTLDFESGAWGTIMGSGVMLGEPGTSVEIHGDEGVLRLTEPFTAPGRVEGDHAGTQLRVWRAGQRGDVIPVPPELEQDGSGYEERLRLSALLARDFAAAVDGRAQRYPSLADGSRIRDVLDAVHESSLTQRRVEVTEAPSCPSPK
jgi:predicted dehydrogenase